MESIGPNPGRTRRPTRPASARMTPPDESRRDPPARPASRRAPPRRPGGCRALAGRRTCPGLGGAPAARLGPRERPDSRLAAVVAAEPGPRRAGLPRRGLSRATGSRSGTTPGTGGTTCPTTASSSRRWPRWSARACVGAVSVLVSSLLFERLAEIRFAERARPAALLFALGAAGDLYIGRLTFALGVTFGLAAVLAAARRRPGPTAVLSVGCAAASPVAALFLVLLAAADLLANRAARRAALLGLPALGLAVGLAVLFPEGGHQTFYGPSVIAAFGVPLLMLGLLPARERLLRCGIGLYVLAVLASYAFSTPMGSNVVRLGVLLAAPILVGTVGAEDMRLALARLSGLLGRIGRRGSSAVVARRPAADRPGAGAPGPGARGDRDDRLAGQRPTGPVPPGRRGPVARRLVLPAGERLPQRPGRGRADADRGAVHALALGRRRARPAVRPGAWLGAPARHASYDALFYAPRLTPAAYEAWLENTGVRFVALSDAALDDSSRQEAALIRAGQPFLSRGLRERALAGLRRPAPDAPRGRPRAPRLDRPRRLHAGRESPGDVRRPGPLHALLDGGRRARVARCRRPTGGRG